VRNIGFETGSATLISKVPTNTIYLDGSATGGAIYNSDDNQVEWQADVTGGNEIVFSYAVTVDAGLTEPTAIVNRSTLSSDEQTWVLYGHAIVNGLQTYFPIMKTN
jgi:hypothetical protein